MNLKEVIPFLKELNQNNNRDWFAANKAEYDRTRHIFEQFVENLIDRIALFDEEVKGVLVKDCIFRIYRDTRFSNDKTPYKPYYSAYIAAKGGRKSPRGGYYLHVQPGDAVVAGGVWCPEPNVLKALRQSVYENVDEFAEIMQNAEFSTYYKELFGEHLKKLPIGFPKDFEHAEWLKPKNYCVETSLSDDILSSDSCMDEIVYRMQLMHPFNRFLNFTVDELINNA